ncbi:MAG TPA: hypothetical protein VE971_01615 [Candidatus Eisenbacteria bacterium]|nr:hypothetical protein [Candidatus Eisenbacteria bacterium]
MWIVSFWYVYIFLRIGDYDRVEELKALVNYIRAAGLESEETW